nr:hypothetical protein [Neorhizobium tomejilense]
MTVHNFPNKPIRTPARELGLSDVPLPPHYAMQDMERANDRFVCALAYEKQSNVMPPEVRALALSDRTRYREALDCQDIEGITVVKTESINRFIHLVTGHPKAWVLSWQLHSLAATFSELVTDRPGAVESLRSDVDEALDAFANSFNREFKN